MIRGCPDKVYASKNAYSACHETGLPAWLVVNGSVPGISLWDLCFQGGESPGPAHWPHNTIGQGALKNTDAGISPPETLISPVQGVAGASGRFHVQVTLCLPG